MQSTGTLKSISNYYLERVGLEANIRLRLNLKNGKNSFGRAEKGKSNDFDINSARCSALHCVITVSGDTVEITNKSKSAGTTINQIKMTEEKVQLKVNDVIGIVRGTRVPWNLDGNYDLFVYRLCKYTSENLLTIEIDDDETYEVSDDDDPNANDVVILDPIDIKKENDLNIELSRDRNAEIKKELIDNDESETPCQPTKKEPSNFFEIEISDIDRYESADVGTFDPHLSNENYYPEAPRSESVESTGTTGTLQENEVLRNNSSDTLSNADQQEDEMHRSESNDSVDTLIFSPTQQENEEHRSESNDATDTLISPPTQNDRNVESCSGDAKLTKGSHSDEETIENVRSFVERDFERTTAKVAENVKRKTGPEVIEPKRMEKRWKEISNKRENESDSSKTQKLNKVSTTRNSKRKENTNAKRKPKNATATPYESKEKTKTTAKVKYTKDNRGAFLTDPTQMPGLPVSVKERRKSTFIVEPLPKLPPPPREETITDDVDISKLISDNAERYACHKIRKLSFKDLRKPEVNGSPLNSPVDQNVGSAPETPNSDSAFNEKFTDPQTENAPINEAFDLQASIVNNDVHSMSNGNTEEIEFRHKKPQQESVFQINPCHDVISILTSYDAEQFGTVDAFCRSTDKDVKSLGDTFEDFTEYQGTILPLIMLELYKEIELEYLNSVNRDFIDVIVTDQNLERRRDNHRMVFHCQVDFSYDSKYLFEGHLVLARCHLSNIEFLAMVTYISYVKKTENHRLAHFTLETSVLTETLPVDTLQIRDITVISNTLNAFRSIYSLDHSPLLNLILNPLSGEPVSNANAVKVAYKGYDQTLDTDQMTALKEIYKRCKNLDVPNISLLDGASGTGKTSLISNLALQLVYGDHLPRALRILICSRSNRNIDEITKKLLYVRDRTSAAQKIQLVRFGLLEQIDLECRCVSVQHMRENEQRFIQSASIEKLNKEKKTLELKILALLLDDENDNQMELKLWRTKLTKLNTLLLRLEAIDQNKLKDPTTVLLNACDIICTTLGGITKLQSYIPHVDVCIIDEASQCIESLTLLPFRFGMPSLVLVGDSRCPPPMVFSEVAYAKNYGNSLFSRCHKLFSSTSGSPIFRINIQHRMHPEILHWPNVFFYKNRLLPAAAQQLDSLPVVPYKMISYGPTEMESGNIMSVVNVVCSHIDTKKYSVGIICTSSKQKAVMQQTLIDHPYIEISSANESHLSEKDVSIIWVSKDYGIGHLCDVTLFNRAITRARRCLLICGADLMSYKSRPAWKSILEDAQERKCYVHMKKFLQSRLNTLLRRKV